MNSAFYYTETYFSILYRMTEPHISSVAKYNFGKGEERNQKRFSFLWPHHTTSFHQQSFQTKPIFSQVKSKKCPTEVLWRTLIHSGGEETVCKNIRSFLGRYIASHLSLFLLALLWRLTLPFWILPWIMSCCSLIHTGRESILTCTIQTQEGSEILRTLALKNTCNGNSLY